MEQNKVLIGMSGGVDSSVAAYLLHQAGHACLGVTMRLYDKPAGPDDQADAGSVARRLGFDHCVLDLREDFEALVIRRFVESYEQGLTPNPCILCNRRLKFGLMLDKALEMGCTHVATGHYARIRRDPETGRYLLYKAADPAKDQTYFLAGLTQTQLAHTRFPLGDLSKQQVRQIALEQNFVNARKRDSQDICFIPDGDYAAFLERYTGRQYPEGDYLDLQGNVVGRHRGAVCYTLGQRKGLGLALGQPVYVCGKDMARNTVTVGPNQALFSRGLLAGDWSWYPFPALSEPVRCTAKPRHSQTEAEATVYPEAGGAARVVFDQPQRAVTPGQAVALYRGDLVLGGGTITQALP